MLMFYSLFTIHIVNGCYEIHVKVLRDLYERPGLIKNVSEDALPLHLKLSIRLAPLGVR